MDSPMTIARRQWLGNGLGQKGSTSNFGTITSPEAPCASAAPVWLGRIGTKAKPATSAAEAAPVRNLRERISFLMEISPSRREGKSLLCAPKATQDYPWRQHPKRLNPKRFLVQQHALRLCS